MMTFEALYVYDHESLRCISYGEETQDYYHSKPLKLCYIENFWKKKKKKKTPAYSAPGS